MTVKICWALFPFITIVCYGYIQEIPLPEDYQNCFDDFANRTDLTKSVGHLIYWYCEEKCTWKLDATNTTSSSDKSDWFVKLLKELDVDEKCDPKTKPKLRREVRRLTEGQWRRLVGAIQTLKGTQYKNTNRYDYLASLHSGANVAIGHFGANFLPWHRLYVLLFEKALQQIDSSITVPYFDITVDVEMADPIQSVLWTDRFFGNADGEVTTGPFKNWSTPVGPLIRNIGQIGGYFNKLYVDFLLTRTRIGEIQQPQAEPMFDFEFVHGVPHAFIGGTIRISQRAAYDPIFFFYHSYIDYVYQLFREGSEKAGVDIENDWPTNYGSDLHAPGKGSGIGEIPNTQGRSKYYTNCVYRYERTPNCSKENPSCGSDYMKCNTTTNRCVSITAYEYTNNTCNGRKEYGYVNNFCVNDDCDIKEWVFFPVDVIQYKPPGHPLGKSMIIKNGTFEHDHDIYEVKGRDLRIPTKAKTLATYSSCKPNLYDDVTVETVGIDYLGFYQEVALPDNRLPISKSRIYVAAKRPGILGTKVLITAADRCGCVCKIYCRRRGSRVFKLCTGALKITKKYPLLYGKSIEEAVRRSWIIRSFMHRVSTELKVRVVCDYTNDWIWKYRYRKSQYLRNSFRRSRQWLSALRLSRKYKLWRKKLALRRKLRRKSSRW